MEEEQKKTTKTATTRKKTSASKETTTKKTTKAAKENTNKKETTKPKASASKTKTTQTKKTETTKKAVAETPKKRTTKTVTSKTTTKKEPKKDEAPKLTIIHEKKEEKVQELPVTKKETSKKREQKIKDKENKIQQKEEKKRNKEEKAKIKVEKAQNKNEDTKQKQEINKKKRYIEISVGSILCVIIIAGLVVLNIKLAQHAYDVINEAENDKSQTNDTAVTQEIGNVLDNNNALVGKIIDKMTFAPNVTASIYDVEAFDSESIPNDLKLRIGWDVTKSEDKLQSMNENNEIIEAVEQNVMEQSIKTVFGPKVQYEDETFYNTNVSTFSAYAQNQGMIDFREGRYTSTATKVEETGIEPFIYQEVQKVVKYSGKIIVYVKVAYVDVSGDNCSVYRDYTNSEFSKRLLQGTTEELFGESNINQTTGEGTISVGENTALNSIRSKLNTYQYTFTLDESSQEYYLNEFGPEKNDE